MQYKSKIILIVAAQHLVWVEKIRNRETQSFALLGLLIAIGRPEMANMFMGG